MKYLLLLLVLSSPALACDWTVSERVDPMTDETVCTITSPTARLGVLVRGDQVSFASTSRLRYDHLTVRVDDHQAIHLSDRARSTDAFRDDARQLLSQIRSGSRLRVRFRDVDGTVEGDGKVCNLPELIAACGS